MKFKEEYLDRLSLAFFFLGLIYGISLFILKNLYPNGFDTKILFFKIGFHEIDRPIFISLGLILSGLITRFRNIQPNMHLAHSIYVAFGFFVIFAVLKLLQYKLYVSTAFDLGVRANILHNIIRHGKVWDSLNGRHGFSGHFWPAAYPLALLFLLWEDPRILLLIQTFAISLSIPFIYLILKNNGRTKFAFWVILLFILNYYVHRVSAFDFHPEALGIPLLFLSLYFFDTDRDAIATILLLSTLTLKEDIAIAAFSIATFLYFSQKKKKLAVFIAIISVLYFMLSICVVNHFGSLGERIFAHYGNNKFKAEKIWILVRFFGSFGFLPLLKLKDLTLIIFPFLEHFTSSYRANYLLSSQYSAALLPALFYLISRNINEKNRKLVFLGITFSLLAYPFYFYLPPSKIHLRKSNYIDRLLAELPEDKFISAGNHIAPHISTRDNVSLFPYIERADYILIDTSWKSYSPLDYEEGRKFLKELIRDPKFKLHSDSMGVLVLVVNRDFRTSLDSIREANPKAN